MTSYIQIHFHLWFTIAFNWHIKLEFVPLTTLKKSSTRMHTFQKKCIPDIVVAIEYSQIDIRSNYDLRLNMFAADPRKKSTSIYQPALTKHCSYSKRWALCRKKATEVTDRSCLIMLAFLFALS